MKKIIALMLAVIMMLCFAACGDEEENETVDGYDFVEAKGTGLPQQAATAFSKAVEGLGGMSYEPLALLGTQVFSGTNYAILCEGTMVTEKPTTDMYIVIVYDGVDGETKILNSTKFDFINTENVESPDNSENLDGGWMVTAEEVHLDDGCRLIFESKSFEYTKCKLEALAYLGKKEINDETDYAFVARGVKDGELNKLFVVRVRHSAKKGYSLNSVTEINLADYNKQQDA